MTHFPQRNEVISALITQVTNCRETKGFQTERDVTTFISRPMWEIFCGCSPAPAPTKWIGIHNTHRVYGSKTFVVESDTLFSYS